MRRANTEPLAPVTPSTMVFGPESGALAMDGILRQPFP
jgi:hypothetical protein